MMVMKAEGMWPGSASGGSALPAARSAPLASIGLRYLASVFCSLHMLFTRHFTRNAINTRALGRQFTYFK